MEKQVLISANKISIGYNKTRHKKETVLYDNLSFSLYKGELACLLGANGVGKSTLLRTICSSQPTLKGTIYLENRDIHTLSEKDLSKYMGLVLTDKTSAGGLLVRELVELGRYPYTGFFGQLSKEDEFIVNKAMLDVHIAHKANSYIAELSDGERQKAMIAKSLAQECPIVILDEPTAFLDIESRIDIMNLLHNLTMNHKKTILLSTHDIDLALLLADRLWLMSKDKGLVSGVTEDIIVSGQIDNFFNSENIVFDRNTGNFLPKRRSEKKVYLEADDFLLHWTRNILERNGYSLSEKEDINNLFSIYPYKTIDKQHDTSIFKIRTKGGSTIEILGFEKFVDFLKDQ